MIRISELRQREIININDGSRLGFISDLDIDLETGKVRSVTIPGASRWLGLFGGGRDIVVPWDRVIRIGIDTILVDMEEFVY